MPKYPNESLRKKLMVAGVPESEHTVEALAAKIPDFDAHLFHDASPDVGSPRFPLPRANLFVCTTIGELP